MRFLALSALLAFPLLALGQQDDPRLKTVVPIDASYLPMSELGRLITIKTEVPIIVEPAIMERKVAIFASDRSIGEVMQRVADTMFFEWVPEEKGYRVRLRPEVAKEEAAMAAAEDRIEREGILRSIRVAAAHGRKSLAAYKDGYRQARADYDESRKDRSPEGQKRSGELWAKLWEEYPARDARVLWDRGRVLAQLSEAQIAGMLNGQPAVASTTGIPGTIKMPADAVELFAEGGTTFAEPPKGVLLIMNYDRPSRSLAFRYRVLGIENGGASTSDSEAPLAGYAANQELDRMPLPVRLTEWGKGRDEAVLKRRLERPAEPPKPHPTDLMTQSDALRWLHLKTGVPIVADAFRVARAFADYPETGTVESFVKGLSTGANESVDAVPPYVKSENGWLTMRHRQYWRRLRAEVSERSILFLEVRASRGGLTLDDYASFAAKLTPDQCLAVRNPETFMVNCPTFALQHSLVPLRFWAALPQAARDMAKKNGYPVSALNGPSLVAAREFVIDHFVNHHPPETWLPYIISTGGNVPEGSVLRVQPATPDRGMGFSSDVRHYRPNQPYSGQSDNFWGWFFDMGTPPDFTLKAMVPLYPEKRKVGGRSLFR